MIRGRREKKKKKGRSLFHLVLGTILLFTVLAASLWLSSLAIAAKSGYIVKFS